MTCPWIHVLLCIIIIIIIIIMMLSQSNMQLSLSTTFDRNATLRAAAAGKYDHIRLFYAADIPVMDDVTGAGEHSTAQTNERACRLFSILTSCLIAKR